MSGKLGEAASPTLKAITAHLHYLSRVKSAEKAWGNENIISPKLAVQHGRSTFNLRRSIVPWPRDDNRTNDVMDYP